MRLSYRVDAGWPCPAKMSGWGHPSSAPRVMPASPHLTAHLSFSSAQPRRHLDLGHFAGRCSLLGRCSSQAVASHLAQLLAGRRFSLGATCQGVLLLAGHCSPWGRCSSLAAGSRRRSPTPRDRHSAWGRELLRWLLLVVGTRATACRIL